MIPTIKKSFLCIPFLLLLYAMTPMSLLAYEEEELFGPISTEYFVPYPALERAEAATESTEPPLPEPLLYEVRSGDTLYNIARSFDVSVQDLMALNEITNANRLSIGQRLSIPPDFTGVEAIGGQAGVIRQVLSTTLTAYTAGYESTGKTQASPAYGITSSGSKAEEGRTIAVDPAIIPIGSMVFIDGIGFRKAEDTGSAIRGAKIDVYMNDLSEARNFGIKKNVKVYVLAAKEAI
ncbi:3D domain-containing protein [Paenibacillus allorhizosphaerae]|uniref:LysM domain-containing protein n=1 Tax=Paenibacillus allorhizosphaerae TaxID=2849866 RepID=A0ABM8VSJ5_9BACL|nr:3D domain-containing protein [Paenibacillus allorhizosphaerae]CAG7656525.1 hypothetical protein PAECIP111802_06441 [Paenibacillus allorhizosphaerae]